MSLLFLLGVDGCSGQAVCVERRAPTRPPQTGGKDSPGGICGDGRAPEVQPRDAEAELIAPLNSDSLSCHPCEEQARDTGCSQLGAVLRHLHGDYNQQVSGASETTTGLPDPHCARSPEMRCEGMAGI